MKNPSYLYRAKVVRVIDGDTIDVDIDLGFYVTIRARIRLARVNTPEIHGVSKSSDEYKKGIEAKEYTKKRLQDNGNEVTLKTEKQGKYGRWLAEVYLSDSKKTLNDELLEKGLARAYK